MPSQPAKPKLPPTPASLRAAGLLRDILHFTLAQIGATDVDAVTFSYEPDKVIVCDKMSAFDAPAIASVRVEDPRTAVSSDRTKLNLYLSNLRGEALHYEWWIDNVDLQEENKIEIDLGKEMYLLQRSESLREAIKSIVRDYFSGALALLFDPEPPPKRTFELRG